MFGYKVEINSYCDVNERSDEEWGEWRKEFSNDFGYIIKTNKYPDIVSSLDIPSGTECFVVWAEWSDGDSFGRSVRGNTEALGIFLDVSVAKEFIDVLYQKHEEYEPVEFLTSDGQSHKINKGWDGYFESLDDLNISNTVMQ